MKAQTNKKKVHRPKHAQCESTSFFVTFTTVLNYSLIAAFGVVRDFVGKLTGRSRFKPALILQQVDVNDKSKGYFPPLVSGEKAFFIRRIYTRFRSCFDLPICSSPGARIDLLPRENMHGGRTYEVPVKYLDRQEQQKAKSANIINNCVNLGSYNYLGFADNWKESCGDSVISSLKEMGLVSTSTYLEGGYTKTHRELEDLVADFLHQDKSAIFTMGYGTNTTVLSSLLDEGSVVLSDSLNHSSIVNGCRGGFKTKIIPFAHNDMKELEERLQSLILCGRSYPKLSEDHEHVQWKKIFVVVEGIYSMEGQTCNLRKVVELCKKYKAYIYLDEAHSIGALGKTGRGICEHTNVDFRDINIMMGTFSKSFGGMGGYVTGNQEIIDKLRSRCDGQTSMSPMPFIVTAQVLTAFKIIATPGGLGQQKIQALKDNANYFRKKLIQIGCRVLGEHDSPVVPMMVYTPGKVYAISHLLRERGVAVVVVSFPAVDKYENRVRFCISAGHTREDLRKVIKEINEVSKLINLKYEKH